MMLLFTKGMNHLNLAHLISVFFFVVRISDPCQPKSEQTLKFQRKIEKTKNSLLFLEEYWNKKLKNK